MINIGKKTCRPVVRIDLDLLGILKSGYKFFKISSDLLGN